MGRRPSSIHPEGPCKNTAEGAATTAMTTEGRRCDEEAGAEAADPLGGWRRRHKTRAAAGKGWGAPGLPEGPSLPPTPAGKTGFGFQPPEPQRTKPHGFKPPRCWLVPAAAIDAPMSSHIQGLGPGKPGSAPLDVPGFAPFTGPVRWESLKQPPWVVASGPIREDSV